MDYKVSQKHIENPPMRNANYLTVYDGNKQAYNIRLNKQGELEVLTTGADLKVVLKSSNSLTLSTDE